MRREALKTGLAVFCCLYLALALTLAKASRAGAATGVIDTYISRVMTLIHRNLDIKPEWSARLNEITVRVDLNNGGGVTRVSVLQASGDQDFDKAVIVAIKKTGSFGKPPFTLYALGLRISSRQ